MEKKDAKISRRDVLKAATVLGAGLSLGLPSIVRSSNLQEIKMGHLLGDQLHQFVDPIGSAKGYFEKAGYKLIRQEYASAGVMSQHLAVGEMDIGLMGVASVILAKAQGADVLIVGTQNQGGSALVAAPQITKFEDLKDQPVGHTGVGAVQHALLTEMTRKFKTPVKMVTIKPTDMTTFVQKKEVVALQVYEPFPSIIIRAVPGWKRVMRDIDLVPSMQCCVIATSRKFATEHPDILENLAVINATSIKYVRSHPDESSKIIAQASGRDVKDVREAYNYVIYPWPPKLNEGGCKTIVQWLVDSGKVDKALVKPDLDGWWKTLYDPRFEQKVLDSGLVEKLEREGVPA